jgi:hypothetical protein
MHILLHTKQSLGSFLNIYQQYKKWLIHFNLLNEIILFPIWYAASVTNDSYFIRCYLFCALFINKDKNHSEAMAQMARYILSGLDKVLKIFD